VSGNESVPKITVNNTINLFFLQTAINTFVISNHSSFRVLFDKIVSVYCRPLFEKNIFIFYRWKWPAEETGTVPTVSAHFFSFPDVRATVPRAWRVAESLRVRRRRGSAGGHDAEISTHSRRSVVRPSGVSIHRRRETVHCTASRHYCLL